MVCELRVWERKAENWALEVEGMVANKEIPVFAFGIGTISLKFDVKETLRIQF